MKLERTIGISSFRAAVATNLARAKKNPLIITNLKGGESYVVLSESAYNKLVEVYEDKQDAVELERLIKLNKGKKFSLLEAVRA